MPGIYDNIENKLLPAIQEGLAVSDRSDFCIGYFNLRGWKQISSHIEHFQGVDGQICRVLVGMHSLPKEELVELFGAVETELTIDNRTALTRKRELAGEFRDQLTVGIPTSDDEAALRVLARQIKSGKVAVKLFLRHPLHAKLYLLHRTDPISPLFGYVGSSNLTMAGLLKQGELNVDVLEQDACQKLYQWFEERWEDKFCLDISKELINVIEESWAREDLIDPYHIYLKMAYHLAEDARKGLASFTVPRDLEKVLFPFQSAAVRIAAHHLHRRGGVLIGDVVGLGKTLIGTAVARVFEDDFGYETLIICPPNLMSMWEDYRTNYKMRGTKVLSLGMVLSELHNLTRFRIVLIDESQNLRNREGKIYRAIRKYIEKNDSKVIMLSATPYNKTYADLSNQLRLFIPDDQEIPMRPECLLKEIGEVKFIQDHQCSLHSLDAFDKSEYADDWRELMRLYLVRRTRSFIIANYADTDPESGRKFIAFEDGRKSYFPTRIPRTLKFNIDEDDPSDQYAKMFSEPVVSAVGSLNLPRYGLAKYLRQTITPTAEENDIIMDLSRAGKRLMGYCRTGLFKRLESCGFVFLQSVTRHILRNHVFIHALENGLPLPIGSQTADMLGDFNLDSDIEFSLFKDDQAGVSSTDGDLQAEDMGLSSNEGIRQNAAALYDLFSGELSTRFKWLSSDFFTDTLLQHLEEDSAALLDILKLCGVWDPDRDSKLAKIKELISRTHGADKVLIFSQFADTVDYLTDQLSKSESPDLVGVTGNSGNPTAIAWRFSPISNDKVDYATKHGEIRVLLATDVLSEGQNLQDCFTVVNFDLPWAIIRLIQRVGRVDRIGQDSPVINCYSFLPADGVERIIRLRSRVRNRLRENAEVVGTDEAFFEDDDAQAIVDLYNEKSGLLDGIDEGEVDLASYAYQIWKNATDADPSLKRKIEGLPSVVYATKSHTAVEGKPPGALVYVKTGKDNDALAWVDTDGNVVSESQHAIIKAAECTSDTPALPRQERHHELVARGVEQISRTESKAGGQLGRPSGARFKAYSRLKSFAEREADKLFVTPDLLKAIDQIYNFPLRETAKDALNRQLRTGISDEILAELVVTLYHEDRLCQVSKDDKPVEPRIICSMGLKEEGEKE